MRPTIVHVEDEPALALFVKSAFQRFGFGGTLLNAPSVWKGIEQIESCRKNDLGPDLIIVDMQLPDGSGLDVIRHVKGGPTLATIPVLVLSGEADPNTVDTAYALGANCYLPKAPRDATILQSVESLYECWLKGALLPHSAAPVSSEGLLAAAILLRRRVAEVYGRLALRFTEDPELARFWLNLSLNEGNFASLLTFFSNRLNDSALARGRLEQLKGMQDLRVAHYEEVRERLEVNPRPSAVEALCHAARITEDFDDEELVSGLGLLFPNGPVVAQALAERMAAHWTALADRFAQAEDCPELQEAARRLVQRVKTVATVLENPPP